MTIRLSRGLRVVVRAVDLSRSSIGILYSAPAEIDAKLDIEMGLPLDGAMVALTVYGVVTHTHLKGSHYDSALKLPDLSEKDHDLIGRFLKARQLLHLSDM